VSGVDDLTREHLEGLGYVVVDLMTLPRGEQWQEEAYLKAKMQAVEEGTIDARPEDRHRLELAMKAHGLLVHDRKNFNVNVNLDGKTANELLDWGSNRHTLVDNSTVQSARAYVNAKLEDDN
jgi:hypothetical protein